MLNRRILRVKALKVLYACAEDRTLSLKDANSMLDASCEAARDMYLFMLDLVRPLTAEASNRIEAARGKLRPSEEDLNPNTKFSENAIARVLDEDPDFKKILERKKLSWEPYDAFIRDLYNTVSAREYFREYMESGDRSAVSDARLFQKIFEEELEDREDLLSILEEMNLLWTDDLGYVLRYDIKSLGSIAEKGIWTLPDLYTSEEDSSFARRLLQRTYGTCEGSFERISANVSGWERDRLFVLDTVLISMGLAEAETFPDIPLRVTINEYVELTKYYSTPKSRSFVNGLLDRLIREDIASGKITKSIDSNQ
ncbi:MAG: transcription antitermination protein NusB [Bacteroidales bacterium]|nr:transcription antitermination protein NusB [Bacteroidales bacterium]